MYRDLGAQSVLSVENSQCNLSPISLCREVPQMGGVSIEMKNKPLWTHLNKIYTLQTPWNAHYFVQIHGKWAYNRGFNIT